MKSVPPVDAPDLSAMAIEMPETNPPKMTSMILSPKNGAKSKMFRNSEESATCIIEKITKRLEMPFQHMSATGMLSASMPSEVSMRTPPSEVMRSSSTATPVNPLGSRSAGSTNAWMRNVWMRADAMTATAVMMRRTMVRRARSSARSVRRSTAFATAAPSAFYMQVCRAIVACAAGIALFRARDSCLSWNLRGNGWAFRGNWKWGASSRPCRTSDLPEDGQTFARKCPRGVWHPTEPQDTLMERPVAQAGAMPTSRVHR